MPSHLFPQELEDVRKECASLVELLDLRQGSITATLDGGFPELRDTGTWGQGGGSRGSRGSKRWPGPTTGREEEDSGCGSSLAWPTVASPNMPFPCDAAALPCCSVAGGVFCAVGGAGADAADD